MLAMLLTQPRTPLATFVIRTQAWLMLTLVSTSPPRSFPAGSPPSWLLPSTCWGLGLLLQPAQVPLEGSSTLLALQVVS